MPTKLYEKEKILDACFPVFANNGYGKTTTAMLAEAAGISKALIFHHFGNKKNLYLSLIKRCFEKMIPRIEARTPESYKDFFEAKEKIGIYKTDHFQNNPLLGRFMYEAFYMTPVELVKDISIFRQKLANKFMGHQTDQDQMMIRLFNQIPLREGVDRNHAYELINLVSEYFRKKLMADMSDEAKIADESYWQDFHDKKNAFLNMVRHGIEREKE